VSETVTTPDPLKGVFNHIKNRHMRWALENGVAIMHGECGFGRPCVGVNGAGQWIDWRTHQPPNYEVVGVPYDGLVPDDAYHKHDCVCVLVQGDDYAQAWWQLGCWLDNIIDGGWKVLHADRTPTDPLDAIFHGLRSHRLWHPEREPDDGQVQAPV
jgi:hypothetical protein